MYSLYFVVHADAVVASMSMSMLLNMCMLVDYSTYKRLCMLRLYIYPLDLVIIMCFQVFFSCAFSRAFFTC